jgi:HlyD family secretion protein
MDAVSGPAAEAASGSEQRYVTALGRITPSRAVMAISAQPGSRLRSLEVSEGQWVRKGDVLAYLDTYPLRLAERDAARVALAEARDKLRANTEFSRAQIEQNRQSVRLAKIAVAHEQRQVERDRKLAAEGIVSQQRLNDREFLLDSRRGELDKARAELAAAQALLERTRSEAAIRSAEAAVTTAEAQLDLAIVRAPMDGQILKVQTYAGERIGDDPILQMSDTNDMHVVAEVYETDIGKVRAGQTAIVTSPALAQPVKGVVREIGTLIYKNDVIGQDPRAPRDTRVVEVRIKLAPSAAVSRLSNLEVDTRIDLRSGRP